MPSEAASSSIWELWRAGQLRNVTMRRNGAAVVSMAEGMAAARAGDWCSVWLCEMEGAHWLEKQQSSMSVSE